MALILLEKVMAMVTAMVTAMAMVTVMEMIIQERRNVNVRNQKMKMLILN